MMRIPANTTNPKKISHPLHRCPEACSRGPGAWAQGPQSPLSAPDETCQTHLPRGGVFSHSNDDHGSDGEGGLGVKGSGPLGAIF
eukprot:591354-Karenia_brevis.AAC.1